LKLKQDFSIADGSNHFDRSCLVCRGEMATRAIAAATIVTTAMLLATSAVACKDDLDAIHRLLRFDESRDGSGGTLTPLK
jgi:hypothetical protein